MMTPGAGHSPARFALLGCYTTPERRGRGAGVEVFAIGERSGRWRHLRTYPMVNPSYLVLSADRRKLYVAHGAAETISALRLDPATGGLAPLNAQHAGGLNPVHMALSPDGAHLLAANYTSGNLVALPILEGGALGPVCSKLPLRGEPGPVAAEQRGPHPHHLPFDPSGRWMIVPDKGLDRVFVASFERSEGLRLVSETPARPGAGPRHACFHPRLPLVYVNNELASTVSVYELDAGRLRRRQTLPTLPAEFRGWNAAGAIVYSASQGAVYVSNRGHDSVAAFRVDARSGLLSLVDLQPSGGHFPRFMTLSPDEDRLFVANQDGDRVAALELLGEARLAAPELVVETGSPACILFL